MNSASPNRRHFAIVSLSAAIVCGAIVMCASSARAAILVWVNSAGGAASTTGNWNPAQLPTGGDQLIFPLTNTYTITFNSAVSLAQVETYREGVVTLNMSSPHTTNALIVGDANTDNPTVTLTTGQLTAQATAVLGSQAGSVGIFNINDNDATFIALNQLIVGSSGNGTLNVTNEGTASTLFFTAGHAATSIAAVNVTGAGSTLDVNQSATIGNSGDATLTIGALGHVLVAQDLFIGGAATSVSQVNLNGGAALLNVDDDIFVGINSTVTAAGTGTLSATLAGICLADTIFLGGDPQGGSATLHLDTGGLVDVNSLLCGDNTTLDLDDGLLVVRDVLDPPNDVLTVLSSIGTPVVKLIGGEMTCAAATVGGTAMQIGNGSELFLESASQVDAALGNVVISSNAGANPGATLTLLNGSTFDNLTGVMHVGLSGNGSAFLNNNSQLHALNLFLATNFGSSSTVEVLGGSDLLVDGPLRVGGGSNSGGAALLNVQDAGSTVTINGTGNGTHVYPSGTIYIGPSAVFNNANSFSHRGLLIIEGGVLNTASMSVAGEVIAHGAINGTVILGNIGPNAVMHASGGPLTLGDPASIVGFFGAAQNALLNVDDETVTILDSDGASLGNTTLDGGVLNVPDESTLESDGTLSGRGGITGDFDNRGAIISAGGALAFHGIVTDAGGSLSGEEFNFLSGGGYVGDGVIASEILVFTGASITATGPLTLGDGGTGFTVEFDGELHIGPHSVTFLDGDDSLLGSLTTIAGGALHHTSPGLLRLDGALRGFGVIDGDVLFLPAAVLQPEGAGSDVTGTLNITGQCTMSAAGSVKIDIGGPGASDFDQVLFSTATLNGTLAVNLVNGFVPQNNQEFTFITGSSLSGTFSNVTLSNAPPSLSVQVISSPASVKIRFVTGSCPPDIDDSGAVDVDDMLIVMTSWGGCPLPCPPSCPADIAPIGPPQGDCAVGVNDLLAVIINWGPCD